MAACDIYKHREHKYVPEAYSEPSQTCEMEILTTTVNDCKPLTIFTNKLHLTCLTGFSIHFSSTSEK